AGVAAEGAEALLQLTDVVAPQHRSPDVEQSVAELVTGLHQRSPRLRAADAVDPQSPVFLKRPDRPFGGRAEVAGRVAAHFVPKAAETSLNVVHRLAGITGPKWKKGGHLRETTR